VRHRARPRYGRVIVGAAVGAVAVLAAVVVVARNGGSTDVSTASGVAPGATGSATSDAPATTPPPSSAPTDAAADTTFTLTAVGDTILGNTPSVPPDMTAYLAPVSSPLRDGADIVFGNWEGTMTDATASKCDGSTSGSCFAFRVPPTSASKIAAAGFTVLNDANNHFHDFGSVGANDTVQAIKAAGMAQTGLPGQVTVVTVKGVRVGFVAFAPYPDTANLLDVPAARSLIRKAKEQSDVVAVYMHAGAEGTDALHVTGDEETYLGEDRGNPQAFAHMAVDEGASLVIASGPHVLRGMEFYKGRLIAYSLGNFAGFGNFSTGGVLNDTAILRVTLSGHGDFRGGSLTSLTLVGKGQPRIGGGSVSLVADLSKTDFGPSAAVFGADGTITAP